MSEETKKALQVLDNPEPAVEEAEGSANSNVTTGDTPLEKPVELDGPPVVFFARLSDIFYLPDWFDPDSDGDIDRFTQRWEALNILNGVLPSDWLKLLFATRGSSKQIDTLAIHLLVAMLSTNRGVLVICDGYDFDVIRGYAFAVLQGVQSVHMNGVYALAETPACYLVSYSGLDLFKRSKNLVYANHVDSVGAIDNFKIDVKETFGDKHRLVDMTQKDWAETYFPILEVLND